MTDLREKLALAIGAEIQALWADENAPLGYGGGYQRIADAVLSIARPTIIEECAEVVEGYAGTGWRSLAPEHIAVAIRALAEKP